MDKIFIDGDFNGSYESKVKGSKGTKRMIPAVCNNHKPIDLGYISWHDWADLQTKEGKKQLQCDVCKHWFFPEEF